MLRFIKMDRRPHLRLGAGGTLLCLALWIGDVPRTAAQGGSIVIDGNVLGGIIAEGLLGSQQRDRSDTPRKPGSRSRIKAQSASDSDIGKGRAKKTRGRAARNSTKPVREESKPAREESLSEAGDVATVPPTQQQGSITRLNAAPSPAVPAPATFPAPILSPEAAAPVFTPPPEPTPPVTGTATSEPQPFDPGDAASAAVSTSAEITLAQGHLQFMGYDIPQASGLIDLKTKIAIMQFQDSIGAPTTGLLTRGQLQMLFEKAATRLQGGGSPTEPGMAAQQNLGGGGDRPATDRKAARTESRRETNRARASSRSPRNLPTFGDEAPGDKRDRPPREPRADVGMIDRDQPPMPSNSPDSPPRASTAPGAGTSQGARLEDTRSGNPRYNVSSNPKRQPGAPDLGPVTSGPNRPPKSAPSNTRFTSGNARTGGANARFQASGPRTEGGNARAGRGGRRPVPSQGPVSAPKLEPAQKEDTTGRRRLRRQFQ